MSIATAAAQAVDVPPHDALIAGAHAMVGDIASRAARCEADRRVSDAIIERFKATALHRTIQPAAYGGYEMGFSALLRTSFAFAEVCASTAWVCGLYMAHGWLGGLFPKEAQDEVWGGDPDAVISGSYAPVGKATAAAGGHRLSGRFPFSSGSPSSDWNLCGVMLPLGCEGGPVPCFALVPKADYAIDWASWRPVGLAGSGSFDVVVDDVFVPDHRVLRIPDAAGGAAPGANVNTNPLYRISLLTSVPFALAMPSVGAASGALAHFIEENRLRETHGALVLGGKRIADFQTVQKRIGEAAARIDAGRTLAKRDAAAAEDEARRQGATSMDRRLRNRRTQSFMAHEARSAINLVFDAAGGRTLQHDHPIQRAWRDVAAITHHISLNFDAVMSMYGQHAFGLPLEGQY